MKYPTPKISFSLLATLDKGNTVETLKKLADLGVDLVHYDVSEQQKTLRLDDISELRRHTSLPFDIHLTLSNPLPVLETTDYDQNDFICIHVENKIDPDQLKQIKQKVKCNFGLAINCETPIEELQESVNELDYVMFMTAQPGVSGGSFNFEVVAKIKEFKKRYPEMPIHVDGGVDHFSAAILRDLGVNTIVSGSYIAKADDSVTQIVNLLGRNLLLPISSIMRTGDDIPTVPINAKISDIAQEIERVHVGVTCVIDKNNHLVGIISDGDLRRLLAQEANISSLSAEEIMSENAFTTTKDLRILDLLRLLERADAHYAAVPVIDTENRCLGIIWTHDIFTR